MDALEKACKWCDHMRPLALFGMSLVSLALFLYGAHTLRSWYLDTDPVAEFLGGEISATLARPDDLLIVYLHVKKFRECAGVSQRRLTGECGEHVLSEAATYRPAGFSGRITLPFQVPNEVIPGHCAFQVHAWFICNPFDFLRDRHYASPPIAFRVLRYDE